jgi:hypothetical protein
MSNRKTTRKTNSGRYTLRPSPLGGGHVRSESVGSPLPLVARSIVLLMLYQWCLNQYLNIDLKKKSDIKSYLNRI